uniref:Uncharacterized protein n=1 Tax=Romanomermis culicivorax TaxID=13658 RepID=A0A915K1T1_ROMCU
MVDALKFFNFIVFDCLEMATATKKNDNQEKYWKNCNDGTYNGYLMPYVIDINSSDDESGSLIIDRWEGKPTPLIDFSEPDAKTENENLTTSPRTSSNNPPPLPFSFTFSMPPGAPIGPRHQLDFSALVELCLDTHDVRQSLEFCLLNFHDRILHIDGGVLDLRMRESCVLV